MKYNVFLIFVAINLISFISMINIADKYQCDDTLPLNTCYDIRTENKIETAYVKMCEEGKICDEDQGECVEKPKKSLFGAKCSTNDDCKSTICLNKKCSYLSDGETCGNDTSDAKDEKCGMNSYCKIESTNPTKYVCAKYKEKDETCQSDSECKKGLVCATVGNETSAKCLVRYSVDDGVKTDKSEVCKSMIKYKYKDESYDVCGYIKTASECDNSKQCKVVFSAGSEYEKTESCSDDNVCPYEQSIGRNELALYVEEFSKKYEELDQKKDIKFSDLYYYTLDASPDIVAKFVDYHYYTQIKEGNDKECLRNFFNFVEKTDIEEVKAEDSYFLLKYTLSSVIIVFLML